MTLKGQGRDPKNFKAQYLNKRVRYMVGSYWLHRKLHLGNPVVTWPVTSRDPKGHEVVGPIPLKLNISKTVRDKRSVQIDHLYQTPYCESNGHVTDDVTCPKRSRSWPRYLWGSVSQLLCEVDGGFKLNTYGKPYNCQSNGHVTDDVTSRDLKGQCRDAQNLLVTIA